MIKASESLSVQRLPFPARPVTRLDEQTAQTHARTTTMSAIVLRIVSAGRETLSILSRFVHLSKCFVLRLPSQAYQLVLTQAASKRDDEE